MCTSSQRRGALSKDTPQGKIPGKGKKKATDAPKRQQTDDEELRQQVRKTLWQAAISGRLENIFPKAMQAKDNLGEATPKAAKPAMESNMDQVLGSGLLLESNADAHSCTSASESTVFEEGSVQTSNPAVDTGVVNTPSNASDCSQNPEIDLEQLRRQARQTFCEAIFTGKLDKVLGQAKEKPAAAANETAASSAAVKAVREFCRTEGIRDDVRATLERASHSGRLNEVLAQHRASKLGQQVQPAFNPRIAQNRRDQQLAKVEDTRDIDELLRELGETPTCKTPKSKKKGKKSCQQQHGRGEWV